VNPSSVISGVHVDSRKTPGAISSTVVSIAPSSASPHAAGRVSGLHQTQLLALVVIVGHGRQLIEDEARHAYANGTVVLGAVADEISEIALNGLTIRRCKLDLLLDQLYEICELLGDRTVWSMGDDPAIDADEDAVDAYRDTSSDGTPVSMVVGPPRSRRWSVPRNDDEYSCGIPSLPNATGNDGYAEYGLIPPGSKVVVMDPPHRRMSKAWAARQDGGSAFKDRSHCDFTGTKNPKTRSRKEPPCEPLANCWPSR
jgi:hypothetical protein